MDGVIGLQFIREKESGLTCVQGYDFNHATAVPECFRIQQLDVVEPP